MDHNIIALLYHVIDSVFILATLWIGKGYLAIALEWMLPARRPQPRTATLARKPQLPKNVLRHPGGFTD